jgi:protein required for attachment to host cells
LNLTWNSKLKKVDPTMRTTYLVVADSSAARIFSANARLTELDERVDLVNPTARLHERDIDSDRPGRQTNGAGLHSIAAGVHGYDADKSSQRHSIETFAAQIATQLENERQEGNFKQLILVAPSRMLGEINKQLSTGCQKLLSRQIDKRLVDASEEEILVRLAESAP